MDLERRRVCVKCSLEFPHRDVRHVYTGVTTRENGITAFMAYVMCPPCAENTYRSWAAIEVKK